MKIAILIFNILWFKFGFTSPYPKLEMISDVIAAYEQPTTIIARVCWKTLYKLRLATMLMTKESPVNVKYLRDNEMFDINLPNNHHMLYVVDINCLGAKYFLDKASELKIYNKVYRWLIIGKINVIMEDLADANVLVDSDVIVAEEQDKDYLLQAVYKIKPDSEWIIEYYGTWTTKQGLQRSNDRQISNAMRRKDLRKTTIFTSMVATDNKTLEDYDDLSKGNVLIDSATKSSFSTVKNIYDFLNATRGVLFNKAWGYLVNGNWTGMVGDLYEERAELCGTMLLMSAERGTVVEYIITPASVVMPRIVFRPPPLSYNHNLFVMPFSTGVWYMLGGFVIILTIILYISAKWDITIQEKNTKKIADQTCLRATWSDIIIFVLSAVSQQGSTNELKGYPGRLAMFIVFLAFVFLYTSYSASIVVLLQSTSDDIRTVVDLTNSKLEIGIEDTPYNRYHFSAAYAKDPVRKAFYETKVAPKDNFMSLEEGVKKMQKKPFAFNMNVGAGYRLISKLFQEHEKCGLQEIDYIRVGTAWYTSKRNSPYSEMFRIGFIRFEEHGYSDRNNRIVFAKKPSCTVTSGNFGSVNIVDFYPVLLLLLYGMIMAFMLFIMELLYHHKQIMRRNIHDTKI